MNAVMTTDPTSPPAALSSTMTRTLDRMRNGLSRDGRKSGEWSISDRVAPSVEERQALAARSADLHAKLHPATDDESGLWVTRLLRSFPHARDEAEDTIPLVKAYVAAVRGAPAWAVQQAALAYIGGRVERRDQTFAPSAAEFARNVRALVAPWREEAYHIEAVLKADIYHEPSDEERERVHQAMLQLSRDVAVAADPLTSERRCVVTEAAEAEAKLSQWAREVTEKERQQTEAAE